MSENWFHHTDIESGCAMPCIGWASNANVASLLGYSFAHLAMAKRVPTIYDDTHLNTLFH
jgi:hypothetical protein